MKHLQIICTALTVILAVQPVHAQWESMRPAAEPLSLYIVSGRTILATNLASSLWRSSDDGKSWERVKGALNNEEVKCLHDNGTALFCGTYNGLHVSYDTGRTWLRTDSGLDMRFIFSMASIDSHLIVVQGSQSRTPNMYRSTDAGKNWERSLIDLVPGDPFHSLGHVGPLFLGVCHGRIRVSRDTGRTWVDTGIRCDNARAKDSLMVYWKNCIIYFSTDVGSTWEARTSGLPRDFSVGGCDITGDTVVVVGGFSDPIYHSRWAVFMTTNAGRNWTIVDREYQTGSHCTEGLVTLHGGYLYLMCNGTIWRRSVHELATTTEVQVPLPVHAIRIGIHPNPSDGRFIVSWATPGRHERGITQMLDLLGRPVSRRDFTLQPGNGSSFEYDARGLSPGAYILVLTAGTEHGTSLLWIRR